MCKAFWEFHGTPVLKLNPHVAIMFLGETDALWEVGLLMDS